jgi:hypothetical protein
VTLHCERHGVTLTVDPVHPNQWEAHVEKGRGWPSACGLLTAVEKKAGELRVLDQSGRPTLRSCTATEVK